MRPIFLNGVVISKADTLEQTYAALLCCFGYFVLQLYGEWTFGAAFSFFLEFRTTLLFHFLFIACFLLPHVLTP